MNTEKIWKQYKPDPSLPGARTRMFWNYKIILDRDNQIWYNTNMLGENKMNEYECKCGHVWLDDVNQGCPMCGNHDDVVRRDYIVPQPETFAHRQGE